MVTTTTLATDYQLSAHALVDGLYGLLGDEATPERVEALRERMVEIVDGLLPDGYHWHPADSTISGPVGGELAADVSELMSAADAQLQEELPGLLGD